MNSINRKQFIRTAGVIGSGACLSASPFGALAKAVETRITILHTNDWHSRIEPFPSDGGPLSGMGGAALRAEWIRHIRSQEEHVLLLDSGDIFQGTAYFNYFGGELEYKLMTQMQYDCVTLGNHDFDNGIEGIVKQLPHAGFDFVSANYDFTKTALKDTIKPYRIYKKGNIKIGVFGLGIELQGLVPDRLFGGLLYNDPILVANAVAELLKFQHHCDLIICLSHLGYEYKNNKVSDLILARKTQQIDLILGGHTHTFLPEPVLEKNTINQDVWINQVGWAGVRLGRIDYSFNPFAGKASQQSSRVYELNKTVRTVNRVGVDNQL